MPDYMRPSSFPQTTHQYALPGDKNATKEKAKPIIQTVISKQKGFLTVEIQPGSKNNGRSEAPEVANYTDKAKL